MSATQALGRPAVGLPASAGRFWDLFRRRLRDPRFWLIQGIVIAISAGHTMLEARHAIGLAPDLYLLPVSTYFIPVVYAGLNFGLEGAVPTAAWCSILAMPNVILFHHGNERWGVLIQLGIMFTVGVLIAHRVEQETGAKERAESAGSRLRLANAELERAHSLLENYVKLATKAQEEERRRLARELHDDTIQTLLLAKTDLDSLVVGKRLPADAGERVDRAQRSLAAAVDGVRRFSRALRPSLLDDLGLVDAVDAMAGELRKRSGLDVQVVTAGAARRIAPEVELAVFRVIQEALHNVERHAQARRARIRLDFDSALVTATVVDDGQGFDQRALGGQRGGLGLLGMRERAKLVGASLSVRSRPGIGTRVRVAVSA